MMWLQVSFDCGDSIERAASDMRKLAERLGVGVEAEFNGVTLLATSSSNVADIVREYTAAKASENGTPK